MKMPFRKKSGPSKSARGPGRGPGTQTDPAPKITDKQGKNIWDTGWQQAQADEGMPGTCGYFRGVKDAKHPDRFVYKRPDGREDDEPKGDPNAPMSPSRRPVPRGGFF